MNRETFDSNAYPLTILYERLSYELEKSIAKRFKMHREITGTIEWETKMLAEMGKLTRENQEILARTLSGGDKELYDLILKSADEALKQTEPLFDRLPDKDQLVTAEMSMRLREVYRSYYSHAAEKLNLTNTTMLEGAGQAYKDIINRTTLKLSTGQTTRVKALDQTIKEFASQGLPALIDKAGRQWSPEGYVNMVIRTTSNNVFRETTFARMDDWDEDLQYISHHRGARPLCEPYQGMLVSKSNKSGVTEDIDGNRIRYIPLSSTSYGEPAGIYGINCGHFPLVFIPGISEKRPPPTEEMKSENDRIYKESQQQRALERRIRYLKGRIDIYDSAGLSNLLPGALDDLKVANANMKEFIEKTGRTRREDRERIY